MPSYRTLPSANKENLPVANRIAEQVLCLPIYGNLDKTKIKNICKKIKNVGTL